MRARWLRALDLVRSSATLLTACASYDVITDKEVYIWEDSFDRRGLSFRNTPLIIRRGKVKAVKLLKKQFLFQAFLKFGIFPDRNFLNFLFVEEVTFVFVFGCFKLTTPHGFTMLMKECKESCFWHCVDKGQLLQVIWNCVDEGQLSQIIFDLKNANKVAFDTVWAKTDLHRSFLVYRN